MELAETDDDDVISYIEHEPPKLHFETSNLLFHSCGAQRHLICGVFDSTNDWLSWHGHPTDDENPIKSNYNCRFGATVSIRWPANLGMATPVAGVNAMQ